MDSREPPISELLADCELPLALYRFCCKSYDDILDNLPEKLAPQFTSDLNIYIFDSLRHTLLESLTSENGYDLAALAAALIREHPEDAE